MGIVIFEEIVMFCFGSISNFIIFMCIFLYAFKKFVVDHLFDHTDLIERFYDEEKKRQFQKKDAFEKKDVVKTINTGTERYLCAHIIRRIIKKKFGSLILFTWQYKNITFFFNHNIEVESINSILFLIQWKYVTVYDKRAFDSPIYLVGGAPHIEVVDDYIKSLKYNEDGLMTLLRLEDGIDIEDAKNAHIVDEIIDTYNTYINQDIWGVITRLPPYKDFIRKNMAQEITADTIRSYLMRENNADKRRCYMERLTNSGTKEAKSNVTIRDIINKLAEYENLEEQGLLKIFPCKPGDTVYTLNTLLSGKIIIGELQADVFFISLCILENRFGKTVFLTQAEAEDALERMKQTDI